MNSQDYRYRRGWDKLDEIDPGAGPELVESLKDIAPDFARYIIEFPFGTIYTRPVLDQKSRELAVIAALTALGTAQPQLKDHIRRGLRAGWRREEVVEVIMQMAIYAGVPAALNGLSAAKAVFGKLDESGEP